MNFGYLFKDNKSWKEYFPDSKTYLNEHLESSWNREQIKHVVISLSESLGFSSQESKKIENILIDFLEKQEKVFLFHKVFKIENISNRLLMVKQLVAKEEQLGIGLLGLASYLCLTCFDSLGQKEEFKTFHEWLQTNNEKLQNLEQLIKSENKTNLRTGLNDLYSNYYIPVFGVKRSFLNFLYSINSNKSYQKLLHEITIENYYLIELDKKGDIDNFKNEWLFYLRNKFTHNTRNWIWSCVNTRIYSEFPLQGGSVLINVKPKDFIENLIECVIDGMKIELDSLDLL